MKKNNLLLAFLVALIATMLVGCEEQKQQKKSPYLGGTQGIFATFEQFGILENGVATIFEDETFPIEVTLKNKGEEDVPAGAVILKIKGISPSDYEGIVFEKTNSNILEKASEFNPEGGEETVDFGDAKYKIPLAGSLYEATVFVTYKYPYKTHVAIPKVCFNRDLKDTTVCVIEEAKPVYSSGGPIQVKAAREKRAGAGIIALEFDVEN
ncbi:MAG: hypothetical protein N3D84_02580, partial [Candidatus Woesearchaeota archaeon]|nr:hypothetical protein [Candidatus Woesearchaeota archaeon]